MVASQVFSGDSLRKLQSSACSTVSFSTAISSGGEGGQSPEQEAADAQPRPGGTDLDYFHRYVSFDARAGGFTKVRTYADCCRGDGKVELHRWDRGELGVCTVAVKRVLRERVYFNSGKERDERRCRARQSGPRRDTEDTLTEIGVYCRLFQEEGVPEYILRMHAVFEEGHHIWMVLENAGGGEMFVVAQMLQEEGQDTRLRKIRRWMWQLFRAVGYIHGRGIGHRDISTENLLLNGEDLRLMDFGQAVRSHSEAGEELRYFAPAGKPNYRAPNMYVPPEGVVETMFPADCLGGQTIFAHVVSGRSAFLCDVTLPPGAKPGEPCTAEPAGYLARPADVFACGVCLFILATGMPPWKEAKLEDPHFAWIFRNGVLQLLQAWGRRQTPEAEDFMVLAMGQDPVRRPTAEALLEHPWFERVRNELAAHDGGAAAPTAQASAPPGALAEPGAEAHGFGGDFYCAPDARRGAAEAGAPLGDPYGSYGPARLGGGCDPYGFAGFEPTRCGVQQSSLLVDGTPLGGLYCDAGEVCREGAESSLLVDGTPLGGLYCDAGEVCRSDRAERFHNAQPAPPLPSDDLFRLERTSFAVEGCSPAAAGDRLVDFLTTAQGVTVTRVDAVQYSVRAEADGEAGRCSLKARLYDSGSGPGRQGCVVELQRRDGDSTALWHVFCGARACLQGHRQPAPAQGAPMPLPALDVP